MIDEYATMLDGYDQVEASAGLSGEPLEAGWYALEVAAIQDKGTTQSGTPFVKLQLKVYDGTGKGRSTFVKLFMGAARTTRKDGGERQRTEEEYAKARASVQAQMKGWLKAVGVATAAATGEGAEKVFTFYNVDNWVGARIAGRITLQAGGVNEASGREYGPQNSLAEYHPVDDPKRGYAYVMAKAAPGTRVAAGQVVGSVTI